MIFCHQNIIEFYFRLTFALSMLAVSCILVEGMAQKSDEYYLKKFEEHLYKLGEFDKGFIECLMYLIRDNNYMSRLNNYQKENYLIEWLMEHVKRTKHLCQTLDITNQSSCDSSDETVLQQDGLANFGNF